MYLSGSFAYGVVKTVVLAGSRSHGDAKQP